MGTGKVPLQDPEPSSPPPPLVPKPTIIPLRPPAQEQTLLSEGDAAASASSATPNYGSLASTISTTSNNDVDKHDNTNNNNNKALISSRTTSSINESSTTSKASTHHGDHDEETPPPPPNDGDNHDHDSATSTTTTVEQPQRPCYLRTVYAFESLVMLTCLAWFLTEILLPLLLLRKKVLRATPLPTIILLGYMTLLILLLGMVESRRQFLCMGPMLHSPMLQAPIYRGFWYSLVGCVGLNLAIAEYERQEAITPHDALTNNSDNRGYNNVNIYYKNKTQFSWLGQLSWSSWLFLQVTSSAMMVLVGWIYILAGLFCFACGGCMERSRMHYDEEWNRYRQEVRQREQEQHPQQQPLQSVKRVLGGVGGGGGGNNKPKAK
jgi:hypothetical protein